MMVDCVGINSVGENMTRIKAHPNVFGVEIGQGELGILVILVKDERIRIERIAHYFSAVADENCADSLGLDIVGGGLGEQDDRAVFQ